MLNKYISLFLKISALFLWLPLCMSCNSISPYRYSIQKDTTVAHGAVVSAHPLDSLAGRRILQQGGNAIDAAITTHLVLTVVYPNAGNIGGGGFGWPDWP